MKHDKPLCTSGIHFKWPYLWRSPSNKLLNCIWKIIALHLVILLWTIYLPSSSKLGNFTTYCYVFVDYQQMHHHQQCPEIDIILRNLWMIATEESHTKFILSEIVWNIICPDICCSHPIISKFLTEHSNMLKFMPGIKHQNDLSSE